MKVGILKGFGLHICWLGVHNFIGLGVVAEHHKAGKVTQYADFVELDKCIGCGKENLELDRTHDPLQRNQAYKINEQRNKDLFYV